MRACNVACAMCTLKKNWHMRCLVLKEHVHCINVVHRNYNDIKIKSVTYNSKMASSLCNIMVICKVKF